MCPCPDAHNGCVWSRACHRACGPESRRPDPAARVATVVVSVVALVVAVLVAPLHQAAGQARAEGLQAHLAVVELAALRPRRRHARLRG